jgi:hypothetical protein
MPRCAVVDSVVSSAIIVNALAACRSRYRAWHDLAPHERRHTLSAAVTTSVVTASLHVLGVGRTMAWTRRRAPRDAPTHADAVVDALARALVRTERHSPVPGTCLSRSLALQWLLARRGIASDVRLGARIVDGRLEAHAWVERGGTVVGSRADLAARFTTFAAGRSAASSLPQRIPQH